MTNVKREAKYVLLSLALGLGAALLVGAYSFIYSDAAQRGIADNVLRFHVNAHSNDAHDQALKEDVRKVILEKLEATLAASTSLDVTRDYVRTRLPDIEHAAQSVIYQAGFDQQVTAYITSRFFPTTNYGNITFPPGQYETLTISIGDGRGRNWWCLMFPPLCYVEMTASPQTRELLEQNIPEAGFVLLTHRYEYTAPSVQVRFRIVEWWQNRRAPEAQPDLQRAGR